LLAFRPADSIRRESRRETLKNLEKNEALFQLAIVERRHD
jgi:hypothetical protein